MGLVFYKRDSKGPKGPCFRSPRARETCAAEEPGVYKEMQAGGMPLQFRVSALHVLERAWCTWPPSAFTHTYDMIREWGRRVFQRLMNINLSVGDFQTSACSSCRQTQEWLEPQRCLTRPGKNGARDLLGDCWARGKGCVSNK